LKELQDLNRFGAFLGGFWFKDSLNTCLLPVGILPSHEPPPPGEDVVGCIRWFINLLKLD
jgi:hypothetical protein